MSFFHPGTPWRRPACALAAATALVALTAAQGGPALSQTRPPGEGAPAWRLDIPRDLPAPVQRAAIDPELRTVHVATLGNLYEVRDARPRAITQRPEPEARMMLAPGGGLFAWLVPTGGPEALFFGRLTDIRGEPLAELRPEEAPRGFGELYLGFRGRLIAAATALDDWRGARGRFRYTFWNREGQVLRQIVRPSPGIAIVAADGTALLLLGENEATAYSPQGELLWRLDGRFRKGAIAGNGQLALLNPADREEISRVYLAGGEQPTALDLPTPVHHLRVAPDASVGVIGGDQGRYFFLDPATGRIEEGERLPFDAELFLTDLELVDRETLAVGVLLRDGDPPQHRWPRGGLAVVSRSGETIFRDEYAIREPLASRPAIDVTYEVPTVIAFTLDTTVRVELGQ